MSTSINESIRGIFARGALPDRVRVLCDWGVLRRGLELTWSEEREGFESADRIHIVLAFVIRSRWGTVFGRVSQCELPLQLAV